VTNKKVATSILPPCVERVRAATELLYAAILSDPLPDLTRPESDVKAALMIHQVIAWGDRIRALYGDYRDAERHSFRSEPTSVLGLLAPARRRTTVPIARSWNRQASKDITSLEGIQDALRGSPFGGRRIIRAAADAHRDLQRIARTTAHSSPTSPDESALLPSSLSMERAADILGEVPDYLSRSFANFRPSDLMVVGDMLGSRRGDSVVHAKVENWDEVRAIAEERHRIVVAQSIALVGWVRERIEAIESAFSLSIRFVSHDPKGGAQVLVYQAGQHKHRDVTRAVFSAIRRLGRQGVITCTKRQKHEIVEQLPELRPHLRPISDPVKRSDESLRYSVPSQIQRGLRADPPMGAGNRRGNRKSTP
jgi:hypothetical protein